MTVQNTSVDQHSLRHQMEKQFYLPLGSLFNKRSIRGHLITEIQKSFYFVIVFYDLGLSIGDEESIVLRREHENISLALPFQQKYTFVSLLNVQLPFCSFLSVTAGRILLQLFLIVSTRLVLLAIKELASARLMYQLSVQRFRPWSK